MPEPQKMQLKLITKGFYADMILTRVDDTPNFG